MDLVPEVLLPSLSAQQNQNLFDEKWKQDLVQHQVLRARQSLLLVFFSLVILTALLAAVATCLLAEMA